MADNRHYTDIKVYGKTTTDELEVGGILFPTSAPALDQVLSIDALGDFVWSDISDLGALLQTNFISGTGTTWQIVGKNLKVNVSLASFNTGNLSEGVNLYYTNERVDDRVNALIQNGTGISWVYADGANTLTPTISLSPFDSDDLSEGVTNLYYNDEYVDDRVANLMQSALTGTDPTNPIVWNYVDGLNQLVPTVSIAPFDTDDLAEGATNLYYDDELVDDRVAALMTDTATITWTYNDVAGTLEANSAVGITGIEALMDAALIGTRPTFNFTIGKNMEWQISDDGINNRINVGLNAILSLENCEDTSIVGPVAGEHLVFDGINWVNSSPDVAIEFIEELSDVFFGSPGPQFLDLLVYDGNTWTNSPIGLDQLLDVDLGKTKLTDGDHLIYDGTDWINSRPEHRGLTEVTTAEYYILDTDWHISLQYTLTGAAAIYLPLLSSANHGMEIRIKDADYNASANNITINSGGVLDSVENSENLILSTNGISVSLKANYNTKNWEIY